LCLIFCTNFEWRISRFKRNSVWRYYKFMYSFMKTNIYSCKNELKLEFSGKISKKRKIFSNKILVKIRPVVAIQYSHSVQPFWNIKTSPSLIFLWRSFVGSKFSLPYSQFSHSLFLNKMYPCHNSPTYFFPVYSNISLQSQNVLIWPAQLRY